jgi:hypothetical protein
MHGVLDSDPALIRRTLNLALSDEMRTQDVYQVFASGKMSTAHIIFCA